MGFNSGFKGLMADRKSRIAYCGKLGR